MVMMTMSTIQISRSETNFWERDDRKGFDDNDSSKCQKCNQNYEDDDENQDENDTNF